MLLLLLPLLLLSTVTTTNTDAPAVVAPATVAPITLQELSNIDSRPVMINNYEELKKYLNNSNLFKYVDPTIETPTDDNKQQMLEAYKNIFNNTTYYESTSNHNFNKKSDDEKLQYLV